MAGWYNPDKGAQKMEHMPFGLVLKEDGTRFRSSEGDSVKLMSLLDEAVN